MSSTRGSVEKCFYLDRECSNCLLYDGLNYYNLLILTKASNCKEYSCLHANWKILKASENVSWYFSIMIYA